MAKIYQGELPKTINVVVNGKVIATARFIDGVYETNNEDIIAELERYGYKVEKVNEVKEPVKEPEPEEEVKPKANPKQLKEGCKVMQVLTTVEYANEYFTTKPDATEWTALVATMKAKWLAEASRQIYAIPCIEIPVFELGEEIPDDFIPF